MAENSTGGNSFLKDKIGPLPMWAWMAVTLALALVYSNYRSAKKGVATKQQQAAQTQDVSPPGNQTPPPVFLVDATSTPNYTINNQLPAPLPPVHGRPGHRPPAPPPQPTPVPTPSPAPPPPTPTPPPPPPPAPARRTYTVVSGDTLWGIASRFLGGGPKWTQLYNANKSVIEATAQHHGKSNSDNGHWIWPGEVLVIP